MNSGVGFHWLSGAQGRGSGVLASDSFRVNIFGNISLPSLCRIFSFTQTYAGAMKAGFPRKMGFIFPQTRCECIRHWLPVKLIPPAASCFVPL